MGRFSNRYTRRLFNCIIICIFLYVPPTFISAQEGFLSIQCCSDTAFKDPSTNIVWHGDEHWWPDNSTCEDITRAVQKDRDYNKSRVFNSGIAPKWCYHLSTLKDETYLIRGTFLFGDLQRTSLGSMFTVYVDGTQIGPVDSPGTVEGVFKATKELVNFCLLKETGEPYISKIEVRPVTSDYLSSDPFSVLRLIQRVDVGNTVKDFRYPYDQYDRVWGHYVYPDSTATQMNTSVSSIDIGNLTEVFPPLEVLQTAISHPEKLQFLHDNLGPLGSRYSLYLYFVELNDSVQAGQRVFDVYVNEVNTLQVDIVLGGSRSLKVALNITAYRNLNLTMVKTSNGSQLGPMINAYEIFEVHSILVQDTLQTEVDIMMDVKNELAEHNSENEVLKGWSGDPCVPASWPGLFCQPFNGTPPVITRVDLSFCKFSGSLPPSITKLTHLKELNMSSNNFRDTIPLFPASSSLTSMDISHNNLAGDITQLLVSLPNLTTLYFGCNNLLNKSLPKSINRSNLTTDLGLCNGKGDRKKVHMAKGKMIAAVTGGCLLAALAVGISLTSAYKRKSKSKTELNEKGYPTTKNAVYSIPTDIMQKSISVDSYTLQFIEIATQKYKVLIGEGGFGPVYRGTLPDGQEVAVKVRSSTSTQGTREFDNEKFNCLPVIVKRNVSGNKSSASPYPNVNLLSDIRHENLVPLLGYCCENDQQILVYPFMSNGSLQDRLYGEAAKRKILDWPTRISIALGAARGLTYLHTFARRSLIHRDVKSSNILLDQSMCAKVADFGFSKYAPQEGDSATSLEVRGTAGYLDPEYYSTQQLSAKSDVFSFGVVLLEIVTGREPLNINRQRSEWSLVEWAKPRIRNARIEEIADPCIKGGYHAEAMWRVLEVAQACIEPYSAYRPCMADIVRELEDALIIENNASEYMKSIDSFGGSSRFSIERPVVILPIPTQSEVAPMLSQPPLPQPR